MLSNADFTLQPRTVARIDKDNPFAAGLVAALPLNFATYESVQDLAISYEGAPVFKNSPSGEGLWFDGTDDAIWMFLPKTVSLPVTMLAVFTIATDSDVFLNTAQRDYCVMLRDEASAHETFDLGVANTAGGFACAVAGMLDDTSGSGVGIDGTTNLWSAGGTEQVLVGVFTNTTSQAIFLNGVLEASSTSLTARDPNATRLYVGRSSNTSAPVSYARGVIKCVLVWDRALTAGEVAQISANPWQVFQQRRRHFTPVSASGNVYTITPSGGITYGGSASLLRTRAQIPSGGIAFAGTAALLRTRVQVPAGSIVFGGTAPITFETAGGTEYTITPSGGITFAGAVALLRTRLQAVTGGIAFGGTAKLSPQRTLSVSGGITFAGAVAELRTRVLVPSGGITFGGSAGITFEPAGGSVGQSNTLKLRGFGQ